MIFGNWNVTENSIEWKGEDGKTFSIAGDKINTTASIDGKVYYEQILLATQEDWLTQNDLYDLNYALVYAVGKFGTAFNYEIFDETLANQYDQFEEEDEEDFELQ